MAHQGKTFKNVFASETIITMFSIFNKQTDYLFKMNFVVTSHALHIYS